METLTLEVSTRLYGLGAERVAPPVLVAVPARTVTARELVAAHVEAEVRQAQVARAGSLALHYLLDSDLRARPDAATPALDVQAETQRACEALAGRRYLLVVDGTAVIDLDAPVELSERSVVCFVRLLPLIGG
ncbi:MAG TPA: hypothetical protein VFS21_15580 [Roseiflexaceae bacterium]|nr:hypothetical protein [Roseiflexaceae bacterium]